MLAWLVWMEVAAEHHAAYERWRSLTVASRLTARAVSAPSTACARVPTRVVRARRGVDGQAAALHRRQLDPEDGRGDRGYDRPLVTLVDLFVRFSDDLAQRRVDDLDVFRRRIERQCGLARHARLTLVAQQDAVVQDHDRLDRAFADFALNLEATDVEHVPKVRAADEAHRQSDRVRVVVEQLETFVEAAVEETAATDADGARLGDDASVVVEQRVVGELLLAHRVQLIVGGQQRQPRSADVHLEQAQMAPVAVVQAVALEVERLDVAAAVRD